MIEGRAEWTLKSQTDEVCKIQVFYILLSQLCSRTSESACVILSRRRPLILRKVHAYAEGLGLSLDLGVIATNRCVPSVQAER